MSTRTRNGLLLAVLACSIAAHVWGISHDLPMPEVDERYFVQPAAYIAASGDLNPHWFGHPGSTVIYPLAAIYRVREVLFHGAPPTGPAPSVAARLRTDPGSFYLAGRLWAMLFSVGALPLVFAIGRRAFDDVVGLVATAMWALVPLAIDYGRVTRTDSIGLFFSLATVLLCLRAIERPTTARWIAAGAAAGAGTASRYFLGALALVVAAAVLATAASRRLRALVVALGAMGATFVLTTPFLFLDPHDAAASIRNETTTPDPLESHGFVANVRFYLAHAIPGAVSWLVVAAAIVGVVVALRTPTAARLLLALWPATILVVISVLSFHWDRWVIPALPFVVLFAAFGIVTVARHLARDRPTTRSRSWALAAASGTLVVVAMAGPAAGVVTLDRRAADPSTRGAAQRWIEQHVAARTGVATEVNGPDLTETPYRTVEHHALPLAGTLADYLDAKYRYLVVNDNIARVYLDDPARFATAAAFYRVVRTEGRVVASFRPGPHRSGSPLEIVDLASVRSHAAMDAATFDAAEQATLRPRLRNHVRRGGAVPAVACALRHLARGSPTTACARG